MKQVFLDEILNELSEDIGIDIRNWRHLKVEMNSLGKSRLQVLLFKKKYVRVYWTPSGRKLVYDEHNRFLICRRDDVWHLKFDMQDKNLIYRVLRDFYLSAHGLLEESSGRLRLHAAAIADETGAIVYWGVSGAGKSTLSAEAYLSDKTVLSDELLFFDGTKVQGTGLAISLKENSPYFSNPAFKTKMFSPNRKLAALKKTEPARVNKIVFLNTEKKAKLFFMLFIGVGLYQMTEYHLSWSNFTRWVLVAKTRLRLIPKVLNL